MFVALFFLFCLMVVLAGLTLVIVSYRHHMKVDRAAKKAPVVNSPSGSVL